MSLVPTRPWRPCDEAAATSTEAGFVEWLRATGRWPGARPDHLRAWAREAPQPASGAIAAYAGLDPARGVSGSLLRPSGPREALVIVTGCRRRRWSRDALRADPPEPVAAALRTLRWDRLLAIAAAHLLAADTRPDDRLLWTGDGAEPWPLGAWIVGATVIFADAAEAAAEAATLTLGAAPVWPG